MSEIEKLMQNAKIKKQYCGWLDMGDLDCQMQYVTCNSINEWKEAVFSSRFGESEEEPELKYPEFTAEKQLELIKLLANKFSFFAIEYNFKEWSSSNGLISGFYKKSLEESIADYINSLWQDLTNTEKAEIKRILE